MTSVDISFNTLVAEGKQNLRRPRRADMTQMGSNRAKLQQSGYLLLPDRIRSGNIGDAALELLGFDRAEGKTRMLVVNFPEHKSTLGSPAVIKQVQTSIAPGKTPDVGTVRESKLYSAAAQDASRKANACRSIVAGVLQGLDIRVPKIRESLRPLEDASFIRVGEGGELTFDVRGLLAEPARNATPLLAVLPYLPLEARVPLDQWLFGALFEAGDDRAHDTAAAVKAFDITVMQLMSAARAPPLEIQKQIVDGEGNIFAGAVVYLLAAGADKKDAVIAVAEGAKIEETADVKVAQMHPEDSAGLAELLYFAMCRGQLSTGSSEARDMFAEVRCAGVRCNLQVGSDELLHSHSIVKVEIDDDLCKAWSRFCVAPERSEVVLSGAVVSFLESGHHSTAQNMPGKLEAISRAVGLNMNRSMWESMVTTGCWAATHPFSVRLMLARLLSQASTGNLTFAIAKRLNKAAPGTGPFLMLGDIFDALYEAKFFHATGRVEDYKRARECVDKIRLNNHLKAPYSKYLYDAVEPDDTVEKAFLTKMASIASALRESMPGSTIATSEAFKRLTSLSANNSIVAGLQVKAYVRVATSQQERMITHQLAAMSSSRGSSVVATVGE